MELKFDSFIIQQDNNSIVRGSRYRKPTRHEHITTMQKKNVKRR